MRKLVGSLLALILLGACAPKGPVEPIKSPRDLWIEAHPTSVGDAGECIEFDGEPCDDDPFDLDDMTEYDKHGYSKKPSPKPVKTAKPRVTKTR